MRIETSSTQLPTSRCPLLQGATRQGSDPQQALCSWLEPWSSDCKAGDSLTDLHKKITKLTDCVLWATNVKSSSCFIISTLLMSPEKKNSMKSLSVFFLGKQGTLVLSSPPMQLVDSNWPEWKNTSFISLHRNEGFPHSCPYRSYTWKSYVWCNSPSRSIREITTKTKTDERSSHHATHIFLCPAGHYLYHHLHLLDLLVP